MREIKFRAWDKKVKKMYQNIEAKSNFLDFLDDDSWAVMQFTGLYDKNGKEIYEGDIVEFGTDKDDDTKHCKIEVKYNTQMAGFNPLNESDENFYVIGNIYENPDLLTSDK